MGVEGVGAMNPIVQFSMKNQPENTSGGKIFNAKQNANEAQYAYPGENAGYHETLTYPNWGSVHHTVYHSTVAYSECQEELYKRLGKKRKVSAKKLKSGRCKLAGAGRCATFAAPLIDKP